MYDFCWCYSCGQYTASWAPQPCRCALLACNELLLYVVMWRPECPTMMCRDRTKEGPVPLTYWHFFAFHHVEGPSFFFFFCGPLFYTYEHVVDEHLLQAQHSTTQHSTAQSAPLHKAAQQERADQSAATQASRLEVRQPACRRAFIQLAMLSKRTKKSNTARPTKIYTTAHQSSVMREGVAFYLRSH